MTEDYFRRLLPQNLPVIYHKVKAETLLDMEDNCNNLCIKDYSSQMNYAEETCLKRCYHKSFEFEAYLAHEFERIFIKEVKEFNRNTGV